MNNQEDIDKGRVNLAFTGVEEDFEPEYSETQANDLPVDSDRTSRSSMEMHVEEVNTETAGVSESYQESLCDSKRRTQSVQYGTVSDFDHILEEMPSRTIGRRKGARVAELALCSDNCGRIDSYNHLDYAQDDETDADDIFEDISKQGIVDESILRDLAVNMTLKRKIRSKAKVNERIAEGKQISKFALMKFKLSLSWRHIRSRSFSFLVTRGKLWHHHLKLIEGNFGTGVVSYFVFLRGIFLLSLVSFLLSFVFISVPQLFQRPQVPACHFTGEEILTGSNCLTNTIMYQGYYTNVTINTLGNAFYDMPMAYLLTIFGYFLLCLIWLVRVTGTLFRNNFVDAQEEHTNFTNRIFCAWDFGILSHTTATVRQRTIVTGLKEVLSEQRRHDRHRGVCVKCELFTLRIISWSFYFGLVGASIAAVYFLNKSLICQIVSQTQNNPIFQDLALPLMVSAINLIMPYIIDWISRKEKYKYPKHQLYVSVCRNFAFKMGLLGVIGAFWTSNNVQRCNTNQNETICWETSLGQEIYRLVVIDFIFTLLFSTFCAEFIAKWIAKKMGKRKPEFLIANNVMDLIYGQTLCWVGIYFSPLLPLINVIKYFILFYVKRFSVMENCRPSDRRWRATQSRFLFNAVQLGSFLLSAIFLSYILVNELPSQNCGPFRGQSRAYDVIVSKLNELAAVTSGEWIATIIRIVTSVWVLDSIAILLLILVLFKRSETRALRSISKSLKEQIALEGRGKMILLKQLQKHYKREQGEKADRNANSAPNCNNADGSEDPLVRPDQVLQDLYLDEISENMYE